MDKKTKKLYTILIIMITSVVIITFYNVFIAHDYTVSFKVPCDPSMESCFVLECDSEIDGDCTDTPTEYYKLVERKMSEVAICKENDFECLSCKQDELSCKTTICDPLKFENICSNQ